ncbi:competence protein ComK [Cytobacillus gottheilii]|uniref:competence protein ComK n=1 Tax=Cytobacillus gottheilii TaxID=859144 RepID=UPI0009BB9860|nr:competence protein ComK [Cytobacillus gottheilii]
MKYFNEYNINKRTKVINPYYDEFGNLYSTVLLEGDILQVRKSPRKILNETLENNKSSFQAAMQFSKIHFRNHNMLPIVICEFNNIVMFPVTSPYKETCQWLNPEHIKDYPSVDGRHTKVIFNDDTTLVVNLSRTCFEAKYHRALLLRNIVRERRLKLIYIDNYENFSLAMERKMQYNKD